MSSALGACFGLVIPLHAARPAVSLDGVVLPRVGDGEPVDLGAVLAETTHGRTMLVLGTHAADFNACEYAQRLSAYWGELRDNGIDRCMMVLNGPPSACTKLRELLELPAELELLADPTGEAGRRFGVSRGWRPTDTRLSPQLKLFVVGIGLGPPWGTLPAVLSGYVGSPNGSRGWIEAALKQGQLAGRKPGPLPDILELAADGSIVRNKFDNFPLFGGWGRRPLELATLRLQNLVGIQATHWEALKPVDERCLTQLGGCTVVGPGGEPLFSWVDRGLCDVVDMDELLEALDALSTS
eukprot:CAMPEP_0119377884 /NCGR_PEP_ID=MMETSP1334-20130426/47133_1 /TAXON_ID=127549 /ORGANISM="Calcidiscus leptoporus, Strain RCC1130" /LENGTH=296 /DNA_ID=CAMNT_0007396937 /DNA_START=83 /DNA_END=973 /DNA_ORIENTATION=+